MVARGTLLALLLPLALLSACGNDSSATATDPGGSTSTPATPSDSASASDSPSASASVPPDWPACGDVWVADGKIPASYKGCLDGDQAVQADNLTCSSGQRIVRYADRFFGVAGGKIYQASGPLDKDKQYLKMVRVCRA
jgi:hypothetical protein